MLRPCLLMGSGLRRIKRRERQRRRGIGGLAAANGHSRDQPQVPS